MAVSANFFRNLGKSVAYSSVDVMTTLAPNTAELARGVRSGVDTTRDFLRTNSAKVRLATRQLDRTVSMRGARTFLEDALNDIKKGNLALGNLADDSYDEFKEWNDESSQVTYSDKEVQDQEDGRQQTKKAEGKLVSGDYRTIQGIQHMTAALGRSQIKIAQYQTEQITTSIFSSMAMQETHFSNMEKQLDAINKNLIQLVKFQSESQAVTNQAHLKFYDQVTKWMQKSEKREADRSRRTRSVSRSKSQQFLGNEWLDTSLYKDLVKENFSTSALGMAAAMMQGIDPTMFGLMLGGPGGKVQPQKFALQGLMKLAMPPAARQAIRRMDSQVNTMVKTMLSRAGSYWMNPNSANHPLVSLLGSIFGVDTTSRRSIRMGNFKREDMNWNGEAQHVLVNVIPKQLSEIKAAILKKDPEYYDSKSGRFQSLDSIRKRTRQRLQSQLETPFANIFNPDTLVSTADDRANQKYWQGMSDDAQKQVSAIINEAIRNTAGMTTAMTRQLDQVINNAIKDIGGTVTDTQRMVTKLAGAVNTARSREADLIRQLEQEDSAFSQIASSIANENGYISYDKLMDYLNADGVDLQMANGGRYAFNGRRLDQMTEEERRRYTSQRASIARAGRWVSNLQNSRNRFVAGAGRMINRAYRSYTGDNPRGYSRRASSAIDYASNQLYRATMLGEMPVGANRQNNGGIVNRAYAENTNTAQEDPQVQTVNILENMNDNIREAIGPDGFLKKFFDNPMLNKVWNWLKNSSVGKAASAKVGKAGDYVKSIFTEDTVDENGNVVPSVKSQMSATAKKYSTFISRSLGLDPNTGDDTGEAPEGSIREAMNNAAADIEAATDVITGEAGSSGGSKEKSASDRKRTAQSQTKTILQKLKDVIRTKAPGVVAGGIGGAALAASSGGSLGLIGGLFLPGGPIGGAIAGMGFSILSQTETFKRIMFGDTDPKTGERDGGLISKDLRNSFKAALPKIVGGATAGVALKLLGGAVGGFGLPGKILGFVPNMLMPGGLLGAAIMGSAGALLVKNESFMKTLFGEKNEDGTRQGAALSGVYNKVAASIKGATSKDGTRKRGVLSKFISAIKGGAFGAVTGATISQLGLLGSTLVPGGPIGAAVVGFAGSILGAGDKFQRYLFGDEDKDGKRDKSGLFSRLGKAFELNVIDPAKNWIKYTGKEFAYWAKEKIEVPFRLAFGPILDSFTDMRDSMKEAAVGGIKKIGEKVGNTILKILNPIGNLFKKLVLNPLGKVAGGLLKGGLFAATSVVGSPFQLLSMLTSKKRRQGQREFGTFLRDNKEANLRSRWNRQMTEGEEVNEFSDRLMYNMATLPVIGNFFRRNSLMADMADMYTDSPEGEGKNSLDWLTAKYDRKQYKNARKDVRKESKNEAKILRLRQKYASQDRYNESLDYGLLDPKELKSRYKELRKLGVNIDNPDDLKTFTYHYDQWKNPTANTANQADKNTPTGKILTKMGEVVSLLRTIADTSKASLDVETGGAYDTEDEDDGEYAEDMDAETAEAIQEQKANNIAKAIATSQAEAARKQARMKEHERVTGNTSGNAHDETDEAAADSEATDQSSTSEKTSESEAKKSIFSSILGGAGSIGRIVTSFLSGKNLLTTALVGGVIAAMSSSEIRTSLGNAISSAISAAPSAFANAVGNFFGLGGDDDKSRTNIDEEGNEHKIVNTDAVQDVATMALNPKSTAKAANVIASKTPIVNKVWNGVTKVTSTVAKKATKEGSLISTALKTVSGLIEKAASSKLGQTIASKLVSPISKFFDDILKAFASKGDKFASLIASKSPTISAALAKMGVLTGTGVSPLAVINVGIAAYSALNGALNPENLFKIDEKYVDGKMRTIAAIMEAVMGYFGAGALIDCLSEIVSEMTGYDFVQTIALIIYHVIADDDDDAKIEEAVSNFKKEVDNYNQQTGNNLSVSAYNDLKNKSLINSGINWIKNLFGAGDKTDYSQYEVSTGNGTGYGKGSRSGALGYGYGPRGYGATQSDARWGNMTLGKFPNGQTSTMATGGCGPTALSNAANMLGLGTNPAMVGQYAKRSGFITDGGANDGLFDVGAAGMGLSTRKVTSEDEIRKSLRSGKPVIMAGKSEGYGATPYTSAGHIVTATGIDGSGNVTVEDPMRGTKKYRLKDLQSKMTAGWSVARGYGVLDTIFGGAMNALATGAGASLMSKLTGMDYETAKGKLAAGSTDTTDDSGNANASTTGSTVTVDTNSNYLKQNWDFLTSNGFTKTAAAGIMGCWNAESGNNPSRIEGYYLKSFPGLNSVLKNNQTLNNYTKNVLFPAYERSNISINKSAYQGSDGNYYPGFGLAQWTGPRGKALFDFASANGMSWTDPQTQYAYFMKEMSTGKKGSVALFNKAKDPTSAAKTVLDNYEMYKGFAAKNPGEAQKRIDAANQIYNSFAGKTAAGYGKARGYGVIDTLFGGALNALSTGAGATLMSNLTGVDYETAKSQLSGGNTAEDGSSGTDTGSGIAYTATGNASVDQQNLVKQMDSIKGKIGYSLKGGEQDPDKGKASCASTVAWAYNKVLGFKPGGSGFASSTSQSKDKRFTTIYENHGNNPLNTAVLQPGDILYQNWSRTSNDGTMQHTEMYAGNNQDLSHGGNPEYGPTYKNLSDYRKKHTMMVRRYTPFIKDGTSKDESATGYGLGSSLSVTRAGQYQHDDRMATGFGPGVDIAAVGTNNKGVESRLDTIISLMRTIAGIQSKKQSTQQTNVNVNYGPAERTVTKPTIVVNQQDRRQLGSQDASNEYLRTQHRRLASATHS